MDQTIPPVTSISPGAIDNSLDPSSAYDETSSFEDATYVAFYMLRFPDGQYLNRDPVLILGRDLSLKQIIDQRESRRAEDAQPPNHESDYARSVTSDDSIEHGSDDEENPGGVRFKYSHCGGFRTSLPGEVTRTERGEEAFLPIHPPVQNGTGIMEHLNSISKRHARIKVEETGIFLEVLGRNGLFLDRDHLPHLSRIRLRDGNTLSIAGLEIGVCLDPSRANYDFGISENIDEFQPEPETDDEAEMVDLGEGSESPLDSDGSNDGERDAKMTSPDDPTDDRTTPNASKSKPNKSYSITAMHKKQENETEEELRARLQSILPPGEKIEKRKGPGRPPANGLMSKRQLAEVMKAKKLRDEAAANGGVSPSSRPVVLGDLDDESAAKARNKKRKRSDSATEGKAPDSDKKKVEEPARSPSPLESEFTAKQLEKPDLTYALMIYKILDERKPSQLNLQQLYKEVKNRWPYYRFKKDTTGWESSVRHTIKQQYFKQGERDGKGYRYTVNTDVDPPTQKSKPAPSPSQPTTYANTQYNRAPYPPYASHPGAGSFRPPYPNQPTYQYQMQAQRPMNGTQMQYATQYNPQATSSPRPPPTSSNTAQQPSTAASPAGPAQFPNPHAPMSAQQYRPPPRPGSGVAQAPLQPVSGNSPAQLPLGAAQQHANAQPRSAQAPNVPPSRSAYPQPSSGQINHGNSQASTMAPAQTPRPSSTAPGTPNTPSTASNADRPLPSEEIRTGKVPQVLTDFINNMKKMCKDLPPTTVNESVMRAEDAIAWVMKNENGDPATEPGKSHLWRHLVGLVQETITVHDRQERARRGESVAQPSAPFGQATQASSSAAAAAAAQTIPPRSQASTPAHAQSPTQGQPGFSSTPAPGQSTRPPAQMPSTSAAVQDANNPSTTSTSVPEPAPVPSEPNNGNQQPDMKASAPAEEPIQPKKD